MYQYSINEIIISYSIR